MYYRFSILVILYARDIIHKTSLNYDQKKYENIIYNNNIYVATMMSHKMFFYLLVAAIELKKRICKIQSNFSFYMKLSLE